MARTTVEERRANLEAEYKEKTRKLDAVEFMEKRIGEWIEDLDSSIENAHTRWEKVGYEPEQGTTHDGELLWTTKKYFWKGVRTSEIPEEEKETATPYYEPIYADVKVEDEKLSDREKAQIEAYKTLKKILEGLEF